MCERASSKSSHDLGEELKHQLATRTAGGTAASINLLRSLRGELPIKTDGFNNDRHLFERGATHTLVPEVQHARGRSYITNEVLAVVKGTQTSYVYP